MLTKTPLQAAGGTEAPDVALDTTQLDQIIGRKGEADGGVYKFSIPRAETIRMSGMEVPPAMGTAITLAFQPTGNGRMAINGDFVLLADEIDPVIAALRANGIEVVALHHHMLTEEPRLFFLRFWASDDAVKLARGLRAALERTKTGTPGQ